MVLSKHTIDCIESIKTVYEPYINFDEYEFKKVTRYDQNLFNDLYTKQDDMVLIYVHKNIADKCIKVKINNNYTISFIDDEDNVLLNTFADCIEDIIGLHRIKGFVIDL